MAKRGRPKKELSKKIFRLHIHLKKGESIQYLVEAKKMAEVVNFWMEKHNFDTVESFTVWESAEKLITLTS